MEFIQNFALGALFIVLMFAVMGNALYELLKHMFQHPQTTVSDALALPQARLLKWCIIITIVVVAMYILIQMYIHSL
ncbi:hypothetical protein [Bacillus paranthracis]|uniref:hypothetical protein n=1 Tax=Bacillus cereus group TaxID=86661 RepID=UPI0005DFDE0A|nr:hypothetical protein [Bacillus paranthracis]ONG68875.1 hypothetical protein BKK43_19975 [Bacillus cereus]CGG54499.1 Uncharacterised protein [Streptococcus pneumoniae]MCD1177536.1 hypothetical protein [Bacillus paranthracis]ONG81739.1 hypothetical protein BKK42_17035 [Bacillus cereus]COF10396.1 Uncharacterised protein [Streptococcus pneumoniae]